MVQTLVNWIGRPVAEVRRGRLGPRRRPDPVGRGTPGAPRRGSAPTGTAPGISTNRHWALSVNESASSTMRAGVDSGSSAPPSTNTGHRTACSSGTGSRSRSWAMWTACTSGECMDSCCIRARWAAPLGLRETSGQQTSIHSRKLASGSSGGPRRRQRRDPRRVGGMLRWSGARPAVHRRRRRSPRRPGPDPARHRSAPPWLRTRFPGALAAPGRGHGTARLDHQPTSAPSSPPAPRARNVRGRAGHSGGCVRHRPTVTAPRPSQSSRCLDHRERRQLAGERRPRRPGHRFPGRARRTTTEHR